MFDINTLWLKINYFGLSHRSDIRKWWVILLLAADIFVVVFIFTNLIVYLANITQEEKLLVAMAESPINYQAIRTQHIPRPLEIVTTVVIPQGQARYDLVTQVKNSNKNWAVENIVYNFSLAGQETEEQTDFIMPETDKYLIISNVNGPAKQEQAKATFSIKKVAWRRVDNLGKLPAIDFTIDDIEYSSSVVVDGLNVHRVTAQIANRAFNSFWQTKFVVVLYSGDNIVGVNYVYFDQFRSGEERSLYSQWDTVAGAVNQVAIVPDINLLDQENIITE